MTGMKLSPAYDIICTALYGDQKMALMMDGKNQNLKRKNFIEFGTRYNVPAIATTAMLDKLTILFDKHKAQFFSFDLAIKKEKMLSQLFKERMQNLN